MAEARRSGGLPFGAVMATGAASQLAGAALVGWLRLPALVIAILVAVGVTVVGVVGFRRWWDRGADLGFGHFTVPVGLAVIGVGLAPLRTPTTTWLCIVAVLLAWSSTMLLLAVVVLPVLGRPELKSVNGVWFIAPAALLADAAGAVAWASTASGVTRSVLAVVALACVWAGVVAYAVLLAAAIGRVARHRLRDAPRAAWWIVLGCGGLAADALGHVAALPHAPGRTALTDTAVACWAVATVLLVPIGAASLNHLARVRALADRPAWPPAFSTGVYALGTAQIVVLLPGVPVGWLVTAVAMETVAVWAVTGALRIRGTLRARRSAPPRPTHA